MTERDQSNVDQGFGSWEVVLNVAYKVKASQIPCVQYEIAILAFEHQQIPLFLLVL